MRARVGQPAVLPVMPAPPSATRSAGRPSRLVITVVGYTPSSDGPVLGVVSLRCGGAETEVGRFGVFPDRSFTSEQPERTQRYGFTIPNCAGPASAVLSLSPVLGSGRDAALEIGGAALE